MLVTANEVLVKERYNIVGIREKVVLDENQSTTLVLMVLLSLWLKNLHVPSVANKPNNTPIFTRYRQPFKKSLKNNQDPLFTTVLESMRFDNAHINTSTSDCPDTDRGEVLSEILLLAPSFDLLILLGQRLHLLSTLLDFRVKISHNC